jgi:hypothetical protein
MTEYTITSGITKGHTYRFKYQVQNSIGWSDYSSITYIIAANAPTVPLGLALSLVSSSSITLAFNAPLDDGGSVVTLYELYMNDGTGYALAASGTTLTLTVSTSSGLGLTAGSYYYFKVLATNIIGSSDYSNEVVYALESLPT